MRYTALPFLMIFAACAGRTHAWESNNNSQSAAPAANTDDAAKLDEKANALFAERGDLAKAEAAAAAYAEAASKAPTAERLGRLSRAYYFLADSHYSLLDRKDDMMRTYEKGVEAGEQGLVLASPAFAQKMKDGGKVEEAILLVNKEAVAPIYWYATNLGKWARAQGLTKILFYKDKIRAYMQRCYDLDKNFFYAAPPRYFGAMYAVAPSYAGGDMNKSLAGFEESLKLSPNYLATRVLMAENYATKKQDKALFQKLLKEVLDADLKALPDVVPEQTAEKEKAKRLLSKIEDLF